MKSKSFIKIFFLALLFLIIAVSVAVVFYVYSELQPVSKNEDSESVRLEIPFGATVKGVGNQLKEKNLIRNETLFYYAARYPSFLSYVYKDTPSVSNFVLKSGIYYIKPSMNVSEILELLSSGRQEYVSVSIPEGFTITKIGKLLEENKICLLSDFKSVCHDTNFLVKHKIFAESAEGYLFPDTYFFTPASDAETVAEQMIVNFFEKISILINVENITKTELSDIVTLASIVEREYRVQEEAPLIASVFNNRLKLNIGLYSCATVEYILTEIEGKPHPKRILIEDTKIDNPYNTYKWAGLPPGPISNPGMTALNAVVNAPNTNYYFFQVKDADKGTHVFTSTFDEHIENHNLSTK